MRTESASVPLLIRIEYEWSRGSQGQQKRQHFQIGNYFFPIRSRSFRVCSALLALVVMVPMLAVVRPVPTVPVAWGSGII